MLKLAVPQSLCPAPHSPVVDDDAPGSAAGADEDAPPGHAPALALAVALWAFRKNFLKMMLGSQLSLPDPVWHRLTVAWVLYCLFMAALNGYIAAYFSTDAWANFKLWGYVFPVAFILGQGLYVARHLSDDTAEVETPPGGST